MKGLKEFLELLTKDKALQDEVKKVKDDTPKIVEIAKKHGCTFTEQEYDDFKMEAVSGGFKFNMDNVIGRVIDKSLESPEKAQNALILAKGLHDAGIF